MNHISVWIGAIGASLATLASFASAVTIVVAPDGTGDHPTIQAAINASADGDVIALVSGTFVGAENRDLDPGGRAITIRSQSADATTCVIDCENAGRGFVFQSGEGPGTRVEDLTITNGLDASADPRGGGILCDEGTSPVFVRCEIRDCLAYESLLDFGRGGGVFCGASSAAVFEACVVRECVAIQGGGIFAASGASVVFRDCEVVANFASGGGGDGKGGGAYLAGTSRIVNSEMRENRAQAGSHGGGFGGGLFLADEASATDCLIIGNDTRHSPTYGGGVFCDLGVTVRRLEGCLIAGNRAEVGSGIGSWGSLSIERSTVAHNGDGSGGGTHVYLEGFYGGDMHIDRTIMWADCDLALDAQLGSVTVTCSALGSQPLAGNVELMDIVYDDPEFCDPGDCLSVPSVAGNYSLQAGSPCSIELSPCGDLIGSRDVGCNATPMVTSSWSRLKSRHFADPSRR